MFFSFRSLLPFDSMEGTGLIVIPLVITEIDSDDWKHNK